MLKLAILTAAIVGTGVALLVSSSPADPVAVLSKAKSRLIDAIERLDAHRALLQEAVERARAGLPGGDVAHLTYVATACKNAVIYYGDAFADYLKLVEAAGPDVVQLELSRAPMSGGGVALAAMTTAYADAQAFLSPEGIAA